MNKFKILLVLLILSTSIFADGNSEITAGDNWGENVNRDGSYIEMNKTVSIVEEMFPGGIYTCFGSYSTEYYYKYIGLGSNQYIVKVYSKTLGPVLFISESGRTVYYLFDFENKAFILTLQKKDFRRSDFMTIEEYENQ